jgi:RNA polymerase sigma-B factor
LVEAVDRFDPSRGIEFPSFAVPTILGELKRYLRDHSRLVRCPQSLLELRAAVLAKEPELTGRSGRPPAVSEIAEALGQPVDQVLEALAVEETGRPRSLDELLPAVESGLPGTLAACLGAEDPELARVEERVGWAQMLNKLEPKLEKVMRLRYYGDLSQQETARRLGISQMQVSRLERRAIARLRTLEPIVEQ